MIRTRAIRVCVCVCARARSPVWSENSSKKRKTDGPFSKQPSTGKTLLRVVVPTYCLHILEYLQSCSVCRSLLSQPHTQTVSITPFQAFVCKRQLIIFWCRGQALIATQKIPFPLHSVLERFLPFKGKHASRWTVCAQDHRGESRPRPYVRKACKRGPNQVR